MTDRANVTIKPKISQTEKREMLYQAIVIILLFALIGVVLLSLCTGRYYIHIKEVLNIFISKYTPLDLAYDQKAEPVIYTLRLPRIIAAVLVGGALSLSGACYQGVFQNPLVAPDMLGVSAGACIGASLGILFGLNSFAIQGCAFIGGLAAVLLTTTVPKVIKNRSIMMLVISGIIVSGLMNSIMGIIKYLADPETQLAEITYWQLGSLAQVTMKDIKIILPVVVIASLILLVIRWRINILSLGESEARTMGIDVEAIKRIIIICATILTASSVCISGTIGWIGLVIPHLARMMVGSDNIKVLPVSLILGSIFLVSIDTLSRVMTSAELPLGILTGLIGAPFYFYLLLRQRMRLG